MFTNVLLMCDKHHHHHPQQHHVNGMLVSLAKHHLYLLLLFFRTQISIHTGVEQQTGDNIIAIIKIIIIVISNTAVII